MKMRAPMSLLSRRTILRATGRLAAIGAFTGVQAPLILSARGDVPIKIGMLLAKSGVATEQGQYLSQGTLLALEQAGSTALGRPCEVVWLDDPDPQTGQQNITKLIDQEQVIAVVGGSTSATTLAETALANRRKIPFFANTAAAREVTGKNCNRYTFRIKATAPVFARALAPYLTNVGKNWYFITASYAYGQDMHRSMEALLKEAGGTVVGSDETPIGTVDFSSFMLKIRQAKPDVVFAGVPAADLSNFLKQYNEIGFKGKIPVASLGVATSDMWAVGNDVLTGIYTTQWYYNDPSNSAEEKAFTAAFQQKYGKPPADSAWMGWASMKLLLGAIENAKSTDSTAIVHALENSRVDDGTMPYHIRPWDHQVLRRFLVVGVNDSPADQWDCFKVQKHVPEKESDLENLFGSKEEVACQMDDL
jgi:branched-chain amino acid transport system substrate-binding protein